MLPIGIVLFLLCQSLYNKDNGVSVVQQVSALSSSAHKLHRPAPAAAVRPRGQALQQAPISTQRPHRRDDDSDPIVNSRTSHHSVRSSPSAPPSRSTTGSRRKAAVQSPVPIPLKSRDSPAAASKLPRRVAVAASNNQRNPTADTDAKNGSFKVDIKVVQTLETQLQYARNGHAVLRQLIVPTVAAAAAAKQHEKASWLTRLRATLQLYSQEHALAAWRQKVAVAAESDPLLARKLLMESCRTIDQCRHHYERLVSGGSSSSSSSAAPLPFLQYFNTWRTIPAVFELAQSLAESAAILLNVPSVRLYQDAIFDKHGHHGPTPWHVDARMAPFDTSHMITFWIPLQPIVASGGLVFVDKSHSDFALPYWNEHPSSSLSTTTNHVDDLDSSPWYHLEERYSRKTGNRKARPSRTSGVVDYMPLALGDVTVHSGWTLHCADGLSVASSQKVGTNRLALAITFVDACAPIRPDAIAAVQQVTGTADTESPTLNKPLSNKADREDIWSYQDWVAQVPARTTDWNHALVPILWPPAKQKPTRQKNGGPQHTTS
jgi:ectoine hydroxylase-related dioxygenase (phytanoyl-CoA dioxygenase family)